MRDKKNSDTNPAWLLARQRPCCKRCVLILLDGLGDRSHQSLDHLTPLQAATTPNLDRIAAIGSNGLFHAARPGMALPSENAHFAMFGYSQKEFPGRGLLESLGAEIAVAPSEVALLAHFVSLEEKNNILVLREDRPSVNAKEAASLTQTISSFNEGDISFRYTPTRHLDGILAMDGLVSPPHHGLGLPCGRSAPD